MSESNPAESPLSAAAGAADTTATEAFALLGNETRLAILLALWEAYGPDADNNAVPFSQLYDRVEYDNPGNFSYHLEKLAGQFVWKSTGGEEDGYELRTTGLKLVQAIIAGAGVEEASLEPAEIDRPCLLCGAPTAVSYQDGLLCHVCMECEGHPGRYPEPRYPEGTIDAVKFDPSGLTDRTPNELYATGGVADYRHMRTMFEGLCNACSGPIDASLEICRDHKDDEGCTNCGREHAYWGLFRCPICKDHNRATPARLAMFHPAAIAFYHNHGISMWWRADDIESVTRMVDYHLRHEMSLVSEEPPNVEVTIRLQGDELRLTFDETVSVVDVRD